MNINKLVGLFYHKLNGPDDATAEDAMRVVVRALRDEIDRIWIDEDMGCGTILDVFNQILGAAGDEVAHICDGDEGPSLHQTPATDPAPVNVAKMQRTLLRKWRKAAQKRTEAQR